MDKKKTFSKNHETIGEENNLDTLPAESKEQPETHRRLLKSAIQEINPKKTKWFKLFYEAVFNEKPVEQICAEYNVKPSTVHVEKCRQGKKLIAAAQALLKNGFWIFTLQFLPLPERLANFNRRVEKIWQWQKLVYLFAQQEKKPTTTTKNLCLKTP